MKFFAWEFFHSWSHIKTTVMHYGFDVFSNNFHMKVYTESLFDVGWPWDTGNFCTPGLSTLTVDYQSLKWSAIKRLRRSIFDGDSRIKAESREDTVSFQYSILTEVKKSWKNKSINRPHDVTFDVVRISHMVEQIYERFCSVTIEISTLQFFVSHELRILFSEPPSQKFIHGSKTWWSSWQGRLEIVGCAQIWLQVRVPWYNTGSKIRNFYLILLHFTAY